jgi:hypothetical protein
VPRRRGREKELLALFSGAPDVKTLLAYTPEEFFARFMQEALAPSPIQPAGFLDEWTKTYPASSTLPLGIVELALLVLYLVPKTRYLGGLLMLAYLGGAVATHLHSGDGMFFVPVLVGVVGWLGLYLRDRKLRALVPTVDD